MVCLRGFEGGEGIIETKNNKNNRSIFFRSNFF